MYIIDVSSTRMELQEQLTNSHKRIEQGLLNNTTQIHAVMTLLPVSYGGYVISPN